MRILKEGTRFKNIFFDFDGVIAESVSCKTDAFKDLYLPYGNDIADKVVDHHLHHGGMSRYEKFKIYHKEFLGRPISDDTVQELANEFSALVLDKVIQSDEVKGFTDFVTKHQHHLDFWIITGTPTPEIEKIVNARNLGEYFIGLHGSPEKKEHWTEHLVQEHGLSRDNTLFLGDATTDYNAAIYSNLHFALREHDENISIFKDYEGMRFRDFVELENKILKYL